jgi:2-hydroxy-3-oxopropionate reductase
MGETPRSKGWTDDPTSGPDKDGDTVKIGFIGLGIMGKPMAANLIKAGHSLVVSTHNEATASELVGLGASSARTPREIAAQVDLVITMLPNSPQVRAVAVGPEGIVEAARPGLIYVDMSSIAPAVSKEVARVLGEHGVKMLDAPVSGGEPKAIDGTLSIMVGGDREVFDQFRDVLTAMGSSVVHVGDVGAGNTTKLANQVVVALNIAALSEALVLAQKAGVAPDAVVEAIRGGLAGSTVLEAKAPMMLAHDFKPGFRISLHIKDLINAMDASHHVGAALPLTAAVLDMLAALDSEGHGGEDHSGLVQRYEALAETRLESSRPTEL